MDFSSSTVFYRAINGVVEGVSAEGIPTVVLEPEVTPGLLAGAEPDTHQFNVTICLKG
jgi:hypothetical protein